MADINDRNLYEKVGEVVEVEKILHDLRNVDYCSARG